MILRPARPGQRFPPPTTPTPEPDTVTLNDARYMNLATFRRNGLAVETPVWFAPDGDRWFVVSAGDAGKVKRLRVTPRVRVAPCTVTGEVTGPWEETEARLVTDPATVQQAHRALRRKYGWQMRLLDLAATLGRRRQRRAWIAIDRPTGN